jgi:hypothetical protein
MPLPTNKLPAVDVSDNPTGCCARHYGHNYVVGVAKVR